MLKNERSLKVYEANHSTCNDRIPKIILQGKWLRDLGYFVGDKIDISTIVEEDQVNFVIRIAI